MKIKLNEMYTVPETNREKGNFKMFVEKKRCKNDKAIKKITNRRKPKKEDI